MQIRRYLLREGRSGRIAVLLTRPAAAISEPLIK
jgi:hypothetical protein